MHFGQGKSRGRASQFEAIKVKVRRADGLDRLESWNHSTLDHRPPPNVDRVQGGGRRE
jgi:hypothetical protein